MLDLMHKQTIWASTRIGGTPESLIKSHVISSVLLPIEIVSLSPIVCIFLCVVRYNDPSPPLSPLPTTIGFIHIRLQS